jgi:hypothetical protein
MKKNLFISLLLSVSVISTQAYAESFDDFVNSEMKAFNDYKDALDKEFSDYLNQPWKSFPSVKTKPKLKPKPKVLAPIKKVEIVKVPGKKPVKKVIVKAPVIKKEVKVPKIVKVPEAKPEVIKMPKAVVTPKTKSVPKNAISFYGRILNIQYKNPLDNTYATMINQSKMKTAWDKFATSQYESLVKQLQETIKILNLNDWGRIKLLEKIGQKVFRNRNEARLFTWFVFNKLKYDIKVGYTRQHVVLLTPINTMVYSTTFFKIDGRKYFAIDFANSKVNVSSIKTYEKSHPSAKYNFDLRLDKRPKLKQIKGTKKLAFTFDNHDYKLDVDYDKVYVAYYRNYPQVAYPNYFKAPVSPIANASIKNEVAKLVEGKGEVEAVNLLLRLVQRGFEYKVDDAQFKKEKVMLPEETLYYPYSDCEDRAILFSKLVRDLLGLEVVGIKYPAHLATAVVLNSKLSGGTSFKKNGKRYYMADPTYMGADIGMVAPDYKRSSFEVIHAQ